MDAAEMLKISNLKITPQRLAILKILSSTGEHPDAETIHKCLAENHPSMSLATVYKTLGSFKAAGLVRELSVGGDSFRYDANVKPHPHFICRSCGAVFDIEAYHSLDEVRRQIAFSYDFELEHEELRFFGKCGECKSSAGESR